MWSGEAKGCATCFDGPANAEPDAISRGWQRLIALGQLGALVSGEKLLDDKEAALLQRRPVSRGLHASVRGPSERDPQLPTKSPRQQGGINYGQLCVNWTSQTLFAAEIVVLPMHALIKRRS